MAEPSTPSPESEAAAASLLEKYSSIVDVLREQRVAEEQILRIIQFMEESERRRNAMATERLGILKNEMEFLKDGLQSYEQTVLTMMKQDTLAGAAINKHKEALDLLVKQKEEQIQAEIGRGKKKDQLKNELDDLKDLHRQREATLYIQKQINNGEEKGKEGATALLNIFGIKAKEQKLTLMESIMVGEISIQTFKQAITENLTLRGIAASIGSKIVESSIALAKSMDDARASVYKLSGGSKELATEMMSLSDVAKDAQVPFSDLSKSYGTLMKNSSNFTKLTEAERASLSKTVAQMEKMGASVDASSKNISIFTQSLSMSASEADNASQQLVQLSNVLQVSLDEVVSGFSAAANTMVVYGKEAVNQFKLLSAESKALGISVNDLIGIVSKSDTFQGAAEQAGKLNAILGGGLLNSSKLLTASEGERIKLIRNAVMESGRQFSEMTKYEQIAFANAAGIKDMTTAQKLFNQNIKDSDIDAYTTGLNAAGMTQEQMAEHTLNAQAVQEKMKITMEKFAIAMAPIVDIGNKILGFLNNWGSTTTFVIGVIFSIITTLKIFRAVLLIQQATTSAVAFAQTMFGTSMQFTAASARSMLISFGAVVAILLILGAILHATNSPPFYLIFFTFGLAIFFAGQMADKSKSGLYAMGASLLMIGIGVHLAASGLAKLADSFSKLNPDQLKYLAIVIGILTVALLVMFAGLGFLVYTGLGLAAAGVLLAFGAAMLMAGAGALLFGMGMSMVIDSLANLTKNIAGLALLPMVLYATAAAMISFALAMLSLVPILYFGAAPMLAFVGLLYLLGKALDSISPEKSIAVKATVESVKEITTAARNIQAKDLQNLEEVVDQIHKYNVEATINRALNITAPFKELIDAIAGQTDSVTAASRKEATVIMKLNDREFGRAVVSTLNEYGTVNTSIRKTTPAGTNS